MDIFFSRKMLLSMKNLHRRKNVFLERKGQSIPRKCNVIASCGETIGFAIIRFFFFAIIRSLFRFSDFCQEIVALTTKKRALLSCAAQCISVDAPSLVVYEQFCSRRFLTRGEPIVQRSSSEVRWVLEIVIGSVAWLSKFWVLCFVVKSCGYTCGLIRI